MSGTEVVEYPPLTEKEIKAILDPLPIYGIVSKENDAAFTVDDGAKNVGNFYFSKDHADEVACKYKDVQVDAYSLGQVYFDLFDGSDKNTSSYDGPVKVICKNGKENEFRLVADPLQVEQAKSVLTQMPGMTEEVLADFNDIPLFMDQRIRLAVGEEEDDEYKEIFPIFFGWDDLMDTCEEYMRAYAGSGENFEASISVSDFFLVMDQMQKPSPVDFRNVAMMPATPKPY